MMNTNMINERIEFIEHDINHGKIIIGRYSVGSVTINEITSAFNRLKSSIVNVPIVFIPDDISIETTSIEQVISIRDRLTEFIEEVQKRKECAEAHS